MSYIRKKAVEEGRAMIRVRNTKNKELATIGVCPACWNIKERRKYLLIQLDKMELEIVHNEDSLNGTYRPGKKHAPKCRYKNIPSDPWERFNKAIKK